MGRSTPEESSADRSAGEALTPGTHRVVDTATGELLTVLVPRRKRWWDAGKEWVTVMQAAADTFAEADLSRSAYRVLWVLIGRLDWENWIAIAQADVARRLGLSRSMVSEAFAELHELGVIRRGPKVGRSYTWRLDPGAAWKGSPKKRAEALQDTAREAWGLSQKTDVVLEGQEQLFDE